MNKKIITLFLSLFILGIPICSMLLSPVCASTTWAAPIQITNNDINDIQSVITYDPTQDRQSHIAWVQESGDATTREIMYANSQNWALHTKITNDNLQDYNPMIDMDNNGVVHIVWVKSVTTGVSDIMYTNSTDFSKHVNVSQQLKGTLNHWPTLVVEKDTGIPHIAWTIGAQEPPAEIYYRRNLIDPIEQVTQTATRSFAPSIDLDKDRNVHCVWVEIIGNDLDVRYTNSSVWPATEILHYRNVSDPIDNQQNDLRPDIVVDRLNNVSHVTWYKDLITPEVYWTLSLNKNNVFLGPIRISNPDVKSRNPSIKLSSLNNTAIIYEAKVQDWDIFASDYNSSWVTIDISQNPNDDSLEMSSIGALDIDLYDVLYATYYVNIGAAAPSYEVFVVDGNIAGTGIPGFEIAYIWMAVLSAALILYYFRRNPI